MKLRVFLVEDLLPAQALLNDLFRSHPAAFEIVGSSTTEAEANLWLEENAGAWDILVADLVLAQGSGISVARRARQLSTDGQVVILSGYVSPGIQQHLRGLGVNHIFDKASPDDFIAWVGTTARQQAR